MQRSGQISQERSRALAMAISIVVGLLWSSGLACGNHAELASLNEIGSYPSTSSEWIPIVDDEPARAGDIRRLRNCAEYPFEPPPRGPWDSIEHQDHADGATAHHRSADRVVRVGKPIRLTAEMGYDRGPLKNEWVRLFFGSCQEWSQVGVRRTDGAGRVSFRLPQRQSPGVYGLAFQVVGDATTVQSQLWVIPGRTEVVALEVMGAAFEDSDFNELVPGATELARWHADRGQLVVYLARGERADGDPTALRNALRGAGFPVGPVVYLESDYENDGPVTAPEGWGEAGSEVNAGLPIPARLDAMYLRGEASRADLLDLGLSAQQIAVVGQGCSGRHSSSARPGWSCLLEDGK